MILKYQRKYAKKLIFFFFDKISLSFTLFHSRQKKEKNKQGSREKTKRDRDRTTIFFILLLVFFASTFLEEKINPSLFLRWAKVVF